ncbi:DUF4436 family protein [Streptomyces hydrogenans]|uniref:DUF4436 family protein n=1 Tax=Streptomyces hydrogenans TaxID=1873719 RepID=UPI00345D7A83
MTSIGGAGTSGMVDWNLGGGAAPRGGRPGPPLGWMAATLFALAAFRNTAPGAPPIGSLLDYLAFFWAESLIAFCVVVVVTRAVRAEGPPPP